MTKKTIEQLKKVHFHGASKKAQLHKLYRTKLCKNIKNSNSFPISESHYHSIRFAHSHDELKRKNVYSSNKNYKQQKCQTVNCKKPYCIYYHSFEETRIGVLNSNLLDLKGYINKSKSNTLGKTTSTSSKQNPKNIDPNQLAVYNNIEKKRVLNISPLIPQFTQFYSEDATQLVQNLLNYISLLSNSNSNSSNKKPIQNNKSKNSIKENTNIVLAQKDINKIVINISQSKSVLLDNQKHLFVQLLAKIPILMFKSHIFSYERNSFKGQVSYEIRTNQVVDFVCQDLLNQKPRSLQLSILSLNKNWESFIKLMETVQDCSKDIRKIEIDIQQFIGPKNIDDIVKIFSSTLYSLKNIKVIKLRIQFDYLEDGKYERDIVDSFLDILCMIQKQNPSLEFQLNIFKIIITLKNNSLEISNEHIKRDSVRNRNLANQMFLNHNLHRYFIQTFAQTFYFDNIKFVNIDFSNLYLTQKKQLSVPHHKYESEMTSLLVGLARLFEEFRNKQIEKLSLKFFAFSFFFDNLNKLRKTYIKFLMNFQLYFQNTPIVAVKEFTSFSNLMQQKLNYKYKYFDYDGDIFKPKCIGKVKKRQMDSQKKFRVLVIQKASEFVDLIAQQFRNVMKIGYFRNDIYNLQRILKDNERITHTVALDNTYLRHRKNHYIQLFQANKGLDLLRRQFLYVYAKMKAIHKRNKTFFFRKEILKEIFDQINLRVENFNLHSYSNTGYGWQ